MSNDNKNEKTNGPFSNETEVITGNTAHKSPFVFPVVMVGTSLGLGGILIAVDAETNLVRIFGTPKLLTTMGALSITAAHGHAMAMLGNARRQFQVPHPTVAAYSNIPFWNANRGYYNMTEHISFFILNAWLAHDAGMPCIASAMAVLWGVGRILYTHGYAHRGPSGRVGGFMMATFASMACLGVALIQNTASILRG